jgi:hypothetical protein
VRSKWCGVQEEARIFQRSRADYRLQGVINTGILRLPPTSPHLSGILRIENYW